MLSISSDDLYKRLVLDNPWWDFTSEYETKIKFTSLRDVLPAFKSHVQNLGPGDSVVLAGSLGAGKSVLLDQVVAGLIEEGTGPKAVLYCSMAEPIFSGVGLSQVVEIFATRHGFGMDNELFLFFDEAQFAKDWQNQKVQLASAWPKARIICAVSSGAPELTSTQKNSTLVLPGLTFPEFMRFAGVEERLFGSGQTGGALVVQPEALPALNGEFHRYVNSGGFPDDEFAERILNGDMASLHGISDARDLNRLFVLLAKNTGLEVRYEDLTKAIGVAKNTLRKYLDYLEQAFLIRRLPRVDQSGKRFKRAVAFKVYLTSPCLYAALFGPVDPGDEIFPRLAETALVAQWLGSEDAATLAYASWRGGAIDLLSLDPGTDRPSHVYEFDWSDDYAPDGKKADKGPRNLAAFVRDTNRSAKVFVLTRENTRQGSVGGIDVTLVPLSLYAYWLARDPTLSGVHTGNEN